MPVLFEILYYYRQIIKKKYEEQCDGVLFHFTIAADAAADTSGSDL